MKRLARRFTDKIFDFHKFTYFFETFTKKTRSEITVAQTGPQLRLQGGLKSLGSNAKQNSLGEHAQLLSNGRHRKCEPGPNPAVISALLKYINKAKWLGLGKMLSEGLLTRQARLSDHRAVSCSNSIAAGQLHQT